MEAPKSTPGKIRGEVRSLSPAHKNMKLPQQLARSWICWCQNCVVWRETCGSHCCHHEDGLVHSTASVFSQEGYAIECLWPTLSSKHRHLGVFIHGLDKPAVKPVLHPTPTENGWTIAIYNIHCTQFISWPSVWSPVFLNPCMNTPAATCRPQSGYLRPYWCCPCCCLVLPVRTT
jgi:hypothetical protein